MPRPATRLVYLLLWSLACLAVPAWAQPGTGGLEVPVEPGKTKDEVTFALGAGAQYIVVRNFKVTELEPTGLPDEYALTILALTPTNEPDMEVIGGILFEIDGRPKVVPFDQGGIGDITVKAQPGASEIRLRAVDSNVTRTVPLPGQHIWLYAAGVGAFVLAGLWWWRRQRPAAV